MGYKWWLSRNQRVRNAEAVVRGCSVKKGVLRNFTKFTGKHLCQSLFFNKVADLRPATLLKKRLAQVFFCGFCEISKNTFFYRTPPVATFGNDCCGYRRYQALAKHIKPFLKKH